MKLINRIKELNSKKYNVNEFKLCILIFAACGIIGYFTEETYDTLYSMKLDKNGFLYGPFLPIYGWGALLIHFLSKNSKDNPKKLFVEVSIITTVLEYLTADIMLKIWNRRWWNYSGYFLNINGYICLFSTIAFGVLGILYTYLLEPYLKKILATKNQKKVDLVICVFLIIYLIDNIFSFIIRNKF